MGFQFGVLRDWFVVHLPHKYGKRIIKTETDTELETFNTYLQNKYNLTIEQVKRPKTTNSKVQTQQQQQQPDGHR